MFRYVFVNFVIPVGEKLQNFDRESESRKSPSAKH